MICPNCNYEVPEGDRFCGRWGTEILQKVFCGYCGAECPPDHRFCNRCGRPLTVTAAAAVPMPAVNTALLEELKALQSEVIEKEAEASAMEARLTYRRDRVAELQQKVTAQATR